MPSWVRYSVAAYVGLLISGSLTPTTIDAAARFNTEQLAKIQERPITPRRMVYPVREGDRGRVDVVVGARS